MSRKKGKLAEKRACKFLEERGFEILEKNFYASYFGEIDIIAKKDEIIYFVEVKSSNNSFNPIYNITSQKLSKLINSAYFYLQKFKISAPFTISAIVIWNDKIEFLENIT